MRRQSLFWRELRSKALPIFMKLQMGVWNYYWGQVEKRSDLSAGQRWHPVWLKDSYPHLALCCWKRKTRKKEQQSSQDFVRDEMGMEERGLRVKLSRCAGQRWHPVQLDPAACKQCDWVRPDDGNRDICHIHRGVW